MDMKRHKTALLLKALVLSAAVLLPINEGISAALADDEQSAHSVIVVDNDSGHVTEHDGATTSDASADDAQPSNPATAAAESDTPERKGATVKGKQPLQSTTKSQMGAAETKSKLSEKAAKGSKRQAVKMAAVPTAQSGSVSRTTTPAQPPSEETVNLNDTKITDEEERQYQQNVDKTDQHVQKQAEVMNKIPGAQVNPEDLKAAPIEKNGFTLGDLNPIKWIFSPVIKLQEQVVRLEQEIMKLTGPIAALQPSMLKLNDKMEEVRGTMDQTRQSMESVQGSMVNVQGDMKSMRSKLDSVGMTMNGIRSDLQVMRRDINSLKKPIVGLRQPIVSLQEPLNNLSDPLSTVGTRMRNLDKQLGELKALISLVLTAIFVAAAIVAIGTPLAAILVWRNKHKLLPKPKPDQLAEEKSLETAVKRVEKKVEKAGTSKGERGSGHETKPSKPADRRGPLPT